MLKQPSEQNSQRCSWHDGLKTIIVGDPFSNKVLNGIAEKKQTAGSNEQADYGI